MADVAPDLQIVFQPPQVQASRDTVRSQPQLQPDESFAKNAMTESLLPIQ